MGHETCVQRRRRMCEMKRILFVDDEPNILQGLSRMLRPMRTEWEMIFVQSGQEALDLMAQGPVDVIVSDMRMPRMDGATLLTEVMKRHPNTVRFALSGQSDKDTIFRSVGTAHQFMAKPCDTEMIKMRINRAFALRDLLGNENLGQLVSQVLTLPILPELYAKLVTELESPEASVGTVAKIIETDVGMTAKIVQCVNSAFFGTRQHISSPTQAATLLGLDTIRSLVLMAGVFSQEPEQRLPARFSLENLWHRSMTVGALAQAISKSEEEDDKDAGSAFTAGLLHDLGVLVLASNCPGEYDEVLKRVEESDVSLTKAESEAFGSAHGEVGAYLLGLWGFHDPVVEAVAFHHCPSECLGRKFSPLTAVHVADALEYETAGNDKGKDSPVVDSAYLARLGLQDRLPRWREIRATLREKKEEG